MSTAEARAAVFAALGDPTRLALFETLADGRARSIAELSSAAPMSRQGVTKHLAALERAGVLRRERRGRETRFRIRPAAIADVRNYLGAIAEQWERALVRLKNFVEE